MRLSIAALLLFLPGLADAQSSRPSMSPPQAFTLPPIGLPLPPIGLPLPAIGLPPAAITATPAALPTSPEHERRRGGIETRHGRPMPTVVYVVPAYGWNMALGGPVPGASSAPAPVAPAEPAPARTPTGTLRLDLQPRVTGQVYVDGVYVGTLDDLGAELTLAAGTRHLEIRQPGYEAFALPVRIEDGRALTYRGSLQPVAATPAAPPAPTPAPIVRKPLYFIPGCYLGDVPPKDAGLPATCDQSRAVTFRP